MLPFVVPVNVLAALVLLPFSAESVVVGIASNDGFEVPPPPSPGMAGCEGLDGGVGLEDDDVDVELDVPAEVVDDVEPAVDVVLLAVLDAPDGELDCGDEEELDVEAANDEEGIFELDEATDPQPASQSMAMKTSERLPTFEFSNRKPQLRVDKTDSARLGVMRG